MAYPGYSSLQRVHEGGQAVVYRALRDADRRAVLLKILRGPAPGREAIRRFRQEYDFLQAVAGPGVAACEAFLETASEPAIVFADPAGTPLDQVLEDGPLSIDDVFRVASQTAEALTRVHAHSIIHRDIKPANLIWNGAGGRVELIDFGLSTRVRRQQVEARPVERLEGTLSYLAPEQSGRMNRPLDERADLYALGATLFHTLTGRPPFVHPDPREVLHGHLARTPPTPTALRADTPAMLSAIVLRLLAKNPEDRYQSATGLVEDLREARERWQTGDRTPFVLGRRDRPVRLALPAVLYGRERELAELNAAFDRVRRGAVELVLVDGFAGVGKTRLVRELERHVGGHGNVLMGKYEQFSRATPYSAIQRALSAFLRTVLASDDTSVHAWRRRLSEATGEFGALLATHVPELPLLLGTCPPVESLPPGEAEARFDLLMRRVIRSLSSATDPLVLFLDDLQWADVSSLRLLERLGTDPGARNVLLVGAWRDHEVDEGHPLRLTLAALDDAEVALHWIHLGPMETADVREMVADTLGRPPDEVAELSALIHQRTGGNPLFLHRFLGSLHDLGLLQLTDHGWTCDVDSVRAADLPDDIVAFLGMRLDRLGSATRDALAVAAIAGASMTLHELADLLERPFQDVAGTLAPAVDQGMLIRVDDGSFDEARIAAWADEEFPEDALPAYRFAHDRIQEAAAALLPEDERASWHAKLARLGARDPQASPFGILENFLRAEKLLTAPNDRIEVADRALAVALEAIQAAAFEPARRYLEFGLRMLEGFGWEREPERMKRLTLHCAEADYLTAQMDSAQARVRELLRHATDTVDLLRAREIGIMALVAQNRLVEALDDALDAFELLGIRLPRQPNQLDLIQGLVTTRASLIGRSADDLLRIPRCDDAALQQGMRILVGVMGAAYYARPLLLPLLAFTLVRMSIRRGLFDESPVGVCVWGLVLCTIGEIESGVAYGRTALRMNDLVAPRRIRYRSEHLFHTHLRVWVEPWQQCRSALRRVHQGCYEGGDIEYAAFAAFMSSAMGFYTSEPLEELTADMHARVASVRSLGQDTSLHTLRMHQQIVLNLLGRAPAADRLEGSAYSLSADGALHRAANDETNLYCAALTQALLSWLMGQPEEAARHVAETSRYPSGAGSTLFIPMTAWLDSLAHLDVAADASAYRRATALLRARRATARLTKWARISPENLAHRLRLIEAEWARTRGRNDEAIEHFAAAIEGAEAGGWWMDAGIAWERLGRFHLRHAHAALARSALLEARTRYLRWGAIAVVDRFDREFADMVLGAADSLATGPTPSRKPGQRSGTTGETTLDLASLLAAARSISQEVNLRDVLRTLVTLAVEAGGATRGALFMMRDGGLTLEWEATTTDVTTAEERDIPLEAWRDGPQSVLRFLARSQQTVLLDDLAQDHAFADDPFVLDQHARTILAIPIVLQGRLLAALYLEHRSAARAFLPARQQVLTALAGQAAVAIENARMYEQMESKVQRRTTQLLEARRQVEAERDRADQLLFNVLPRTIAQELKDIGHARPFFVPEATVLFTDFKGFTRLASRRTPRQVVDALESCFVAFDHIIDRWEVEKLKTIGDGYMAAAGVPHPIDHHELRCVLAGLQMLQVVERAMASGRSDLAGVRVGLHSGPVVAGVIGQRRFAFDIWGDTVNTASRMESSGTAGRINVSRATWDVVQPFVRGESRGRATVKGKGRLEMFYIDDVRLDALPSEVWRHRWSLPLPTLAPLFHEDDDSDG